MRLASLPLLLSMLFTTGCASGLARAGGQAAAGVGSALVTIGNGAAVLADTSAGLLVLAAGLAAFGDSLHHNTAGGPSDEAYAARLRSAPIHADDPWVGWPPP